MPRTDEEDGKNGDSPRVTGLVGMCKTLSFIFYKVQVKETILHSLSLYIQRFIEFLLPVIELNKKHLTEMS